MKFINLEDRMTGKLVLVELKSIAMITQATERDLHLTDYEAKMNKGYLEQFDDTIEFSLIATTAGVIHVKEDIHLVAAKIIDASDNSIENEEPLVVEDASKNGKKDLQDKVIKILNDVRDTYYFETDGVRDGLAEAIEEIKKLFNQQSRVENKTTP